MCSHWLAFSHFCLNPILTGTLNVSKNKPTKIKFSHNKLILILEKISGRNIKLVKSKGS